MSFKQKKIYEALILLLLFFGVTGFMAQKNPLEGIWLERFSDVNKLNEYSKSTPIKLSDVLIEKKNLNGAILIGGEFIDTEWKEVDIEDSTITKIVFKDCKFTEVSLTGTKFTDIIFDNCTFTDTDFDESQFVNVRFINSSLENTDFFKIVKSHIIFDNVKINKSTFDRAQAELIFKNTKITNGNFTSLKSPSSLTFTKSELDVDFSRSKIDRLEITDSELSEPGGGNTTVKELILRGNKGNRIGFGDSSIQRATIENADMTDQIIGIVRTSVKDLLIINSKGEVAAIKATIGKIKILNSPKVLIDVDEATAESFYISGSTIQTGLFEKFKAKKLEFENVTLDGKMNFRDAQVDQFINKNTTQTPKAVIDLSGSNIKF